MIVTLYIFQARYLNKETIRLVLANYKSLRALNTGVRAAYTHPTGSFHAFFGYFPLLWLNIPSDHRRFWAALSGFQRSIYLAGLTSSATMFYKVGVVFNGQIK